MGIQCPLFHAPAFNFNTHGETHGELRTCQWAHTSPTEVELAIKLLVYTKVKVTSCPYKGEAGKLPLQRWRWQAAPTKVKLASCPYKGEAGKLPVQKWSWQAVPTKVKVTSCPYKGEGDKLQVQRWRWQAVPTKVKLTSCPYKGEHDKLPIQRWHMYTGCMPLQQPVQTMYKGIDWLQPLTVFFAKCRASPLRLYNMHILLDSRKH